MLGWLPLGASPFRRGLFFFFGPPTKIWTAPLGGLLLQKKHTASRRCAYPHAPPTPPHPPPPSIRRLFAFFHAAPPSVFLSHRSSGDGTGRVSGSATAFCLPSRLSKQITALGHKTPDFFFFFFFTCYDKSQQHSRDLPLPAERNSTRWPTSVFRCFTGL